MKVSIKYMAQAKRAADRAEESLDLEGGASLGELLKLLGERHGAALARLLGGSALLFVGDEQVRGDPGRVLRDGDTVTVLAPMAGG
jgi:sulfur-carrier protein